MSKHSRILAIALALLMAVTGIGASSISASAAAGNTAAAFAAAESASTAESTVAAKDSAGKGKYVADVYFAYADSEEEAVKWLQEHGWEPIKGNNDFNAGKESYFDNAMAVAMGIKRTDKADEAITDMAVVNMKGGYSFPDYEALVKEKKAEIDEFVNRYFPVIEEYRANYNGEGSEFGKKRAQIAHDALNKFFDGGEEEDPYKKNDTSLPLGDLLLQKTVQEGNKDGADLQQIILEGNSGIIYLMEQMMAFAADNGKESWIKRLESLSGDALIENLEKYVPEAAGQNVSGSAAMQYLNQHFGDTAKILMAQWEEVHDDLVWIRNFSAKYDLKRKNGETDDAWSARADQFFEDLKKKDPETYDNSYDRYQDMSLLYYLLYSTPYAGEWGETLGDFFNPAGDAGYAKDPDTFLPFAAALSNGQRAAAEMVSLWSLLLIGSGNEEGLALVKPEIDKTYAGDGTFSLYFGINRAIFRGGAALTSAAEMAQNMGHGSAYDLLYNNTGALAIASYAVAAAGLISMIAGGVMIAKRGTETVLKVYEETVPTQVEIIQPSQEAVDRLRRAEEAYKSYPIGKIPQDVKGERIAAWENWKAEEHWKFIREHTEERTEEVTQTSKMGYAGRTMLCIGAVLLIGSAVYNGYRFYSYYQKTFTPIPLLIVDEADIVTYTKDADGKEVKNINFDQYAYYSVAKCNRQERGKQKDWQSGVDKYAEWGCGDAVDLNGDFGQEWLALYTIKNSAKGAPILADSLTLQYGSDALPKNCTQKLHFFTMTNAVDLGDTAYSYNNDKNGVYFFWDADQKAIANKTASSFGAGQMALAGAGGLVLGLLAATLVFTSKKKKKEEQAA